MLLLPWGCTAASSQAAKPVTVISVSNGLSSRKPLKWGNIAFCNRENV